MERVERQTTRKIFIAAASGIVLAAVFFAAALLPAGPGESAKKFVLEKGSGLSQVAASLQSEGIIRSSLAFRILAQARQHDMKAGTYRLSPGDSSPAILSALVAGPPVARVTIPEGLSAYDIDQLLSDNNVLGRGDMIAYASAHSLEGHLFPDTYEFPIADTAEDVANMMEENFNTKAIPVLEKDGAHEKENLIIASLLEKEVTSSGDRRVVAGIIKKRLAAGMPLQIDATVCYAKRLALPSVGSFHCYPLSALDFVLPSPYNTYYKKGLPPGPIGSPGASALQAALNSENSPYWYYLSDPATGRTIFSKNQDEQALNRSRYLKI